MWLLKGLDYETYRKRQWDFYYIMTKKTIKHAWADVGLIFTAYNLQRLFNLIDQNTLKQYLKALVLTYNSLLNDFKAFYGFIILQKYILYLIQKRFHCPAKPIYLLQN